MSEIRDDALRIVEAALFAADAPLSVTEVADLLGGHGDARETLRRLAADYDGRGLRIVERGGRWHFETAGDLAHILRRERQEPRRLGRAAIETLAIIAYHEPATRGDIEGVRGVQVSPGTLDVLMEAGWIRPAGRREAPGRPLMYATTPGFLVHFGLGSRRDLPGIEDLRASGLLDPMDEMADERETGDERADR